MPVTNHLASLTTNQSQQQNHFTRCPHVILMGDWDEPPGTITSTALSLVTTNADRAESVPPISGAGPLKCHDCSSRKPLWACLRANCGYIGCGGGGGGVDSSSKHSSLHAQRMHHPLAYNLGTRLVWCELCQCRVQLEANEPAAIGARWLLPHQQHPQHGLKPDDEGIKCCNNEADPSLDESSSSQICDDFDIVNYLDQDNGKG